MDINNPCTAAFLGISLHYAKFNKEYKARGLTIECKLLKDDPSDKYDNHPYGIQIIVKSNKTKRIENQVTESYVFTKECLENIDGEAINYKIKEMVKDVEKRRKTVTVIELAKLFKPSGNTMCYFNVVDTKSAKDLGSFNTQDICDPEGYSRAYDDDLKREVNACYIEDKYSIRVEI